MDFLFYFFIYSLGKDYFKFLTKYLATFSGEDAYTMSEAKEEAVRTIMEFVRAPDMFQVFEPIKYIYIYVCMYVCVCMYAYVCMYVYIKLMVLISKILR